MAELKIQLTQTNDLDWLIDAANEVANAAESDFADMEAKAWYKRLWEVVTFSKDNEIHLASGVSNLAKLQEIIVRAMLVVSQDNVCISKEVAKISETIGKLATVDTRLLQEINKIKYGDNHSAWFNELDRAKKTIMVSLVVMADSDVEPNIGSKQYISSLMKLAGISIFEPVAIENIDKLTLAEQELLYQMIMIHRHLLNVAYDAESMIVDELSIKKRRKEEIYEAISTTSKNVTPEFFSSFYEDGTNGCSVIDDSGVFWVETEDIDKIDGNFSLEDPIDFSAFEEITISKILHIPPERTQQYHNKIIHIHSFINCEGTLEFDTCVIHYGEEGHAGVIDLGNNATISMKRCTIENHSYGKQYLIEATSQNKAKFSNCEFINCCYFININGALTIDGCQVICPGENFVSAYLADSTDITGCKFKLQDKPTFYPEKIQGDIISADKINFAESEVDGSFSFSTPEDTKKLESIEQYNFLRMSSGTIKNISFSNCSSRLRGNYREEISISLCTFDSCYSCIEGLVKIEDCVFNRCSKIVTAAKKGSRITNCQFNNCFCELIATGYDGGITLEFCEFNNWYSSKPGDSLMYSLGLSDPSMLLFKRTRKDGQRSVVQRCIFNGATAYQSFLIEGDILEKVKGMAVSVENCFFANCTTERHSGKIIKEYAHYYGRFNAKKEQQVVSISNCQGLDRINKESSENTEVVIKTKNSVGATIGVGAAFAVAGVPGYVVASLIKKAASDDDIHVE